MMADGPSRLWRAWEWFLRHNPMYLLSAACMAEGARLLLVHPHARAGDLGLILMTLGVLQAYEWAVATILIVLHRSHRSREDEPSILLVAALFWTGPLAATAELTAHRAELGLIAAVAAGLVTLAEMAVVRRVLGLRFGLISQAAAGACIALLVATPPLVRIPEEMHGGNELFLYAAWWLVAGIALLAIPAARRAWRRWEATAGARASLPAVLALPATAIVATAAHLVAMNYAYFAHAKLFYASPLMVAAAVVGMEVLALLKVRDWRWVAAAAVWPLAAIVFAYDSFASEVPTRLLPVWLSEPLAVMLALAAVAWWFGGLRLRRATLFHVGSAAAVAAALRFAKLLSAAGVRMPAVADEYASVRDVLVVLFYAAAIYLAVSAVVRRSAMEGVAALVIHQAAVTLWLWDRMAGDTLIIGLVGGWSWLIALHLLERAPRWAQAAWPVALLMIVAWTHDFDEAVRWYARMHGVAVVAAMMLVHVCRLAEGYRILAMVAGASHLAFVAVRTLATGPRATEWAVVAGAFVLLIGAAALSWFKESLLQRVERPRLAEAPEPAPPSEGSE